MLLPKFSLPFPEEDSVFKVATAARAAKISGAKVLDASLGALYDEEGVLVTYKSAFDALRSLDNAQMAAYAPITGGAAFKETVKSWILPDNCPYKKQAEVSSSMGGSGALYLALSQFFDEGDNILLFSPYWAPYNLFTQARKLSPNTVPLLKDNKEFNKEETKSKLEELARTGKRIGIVLNTPANNPTGYSLSKEEWDFLIELINELSKQANIVLINDIAYVDYCKDLEKSKSYMNDLAKLSENVLLAFCVSFSKTLSYYGLRLGAMIYYNKNEDTLTELRRRITLANRYTWSNPNHGALLSLNKLDIDAYKEENAKYKSMLQERAEIFMKKADEIGLKYLPYKEGFFICVPGCADNEKYAQRLAKANVFVLNQNTVLRIAICSLTKKECEEIAVILKEQEN